MGDDEEDAAEAEDELLDNLHRVDVEVIGRLVEQEEVWLRCKDHKQ
eukprot:CAMPEP_0183368496 /NCGR_PEP_ID=MMETSP0164_2-20130417/96173_1 /TAXON_ID=221442 /ORGANISM="Coccolithus pelagicus ssp braarudi, Strain PLY182g" /LENGTH=45 /DNA_ID= /DNA_START= /DNA_END= /DNA_ORIENTATION=